jgi:hypothetical protein
MGFSVRFPRLVEIVLRATLCCIVAAWLTLVPAPVRAQLANTCNAATTQGAAPADFQGYCWLDLTGYNDATARTAGGQAFGWNLPDGTRVTATVRASANSVAAVASPAWTGAAFGNSFGGFGGIAGRPTLYTTAAGTATVTVSAITVTPPSGIGASAYMFVVADAESTDGAEAIAITTNGGAWTQLALLSGGGPTPPATASGGGLTMTISGNGGGSPGSDYIFGSTSPTSVTATLTAGGLQGVAFAVRFASIRLSKSIVGTRLNAADQFTYRITSTSGGATLATGTTTGAGNGPYTAATVSLASGLAMTLAESMAGGSASNLSAYSARLTCTNATSGSSTPMPNNVAVSTAGTTASYSFGTLQYGDSVACAFTNTPFPTIQLVKVLGGAGRVFAADQFTMTVTSGATVVATTTTTGSGLTVSTGSTPVTLVTPATAYSFAEAAAGTTNLNYYTSGIACANSYTASTTVLPTTIGGAVTPALADKIVCTITNTPKPAKADLVMTKVSTILSDPVNGTTNPKLIPGAIVRYLITVTNQGNGPVDASTTASPTITLIDPITDALGSYVQGTAVTFTDGTPASALACAYATCVSWTKTAGGTTGFGAALAPDAQGFDDAITGIRIRPTGTFAAATSAGQPFFTIRFDARIK